MSVPGTAGQPLSTDQIDRVVGAVAAVDTVSGEIKLGSTRIDLGGMLSWDPPHCEPFRELLVHPRLKPVLEEILGLNYRMDHSPVRVAVSSTCWMAEFGWSESRSRFGRARSYALSG